MLEQQEKLWDYLAIAPGQTGNPTTVHITLDNISQYATVAQDSDPRYHRVGVNLEYGGVLLAMPTMVLTYAPLLREDIAEANGFVALEQSQSARRQTPFAKCEIRWAGPVQAWDTITASRRVLEKYERRGSRFVTFRVEASNQHGQHVAEYDYTCIFEYAKGQRETPDTPGSASPAPGGPAHQAPAGPASPRLLDYSTAAEGLQMAALSITESQEIMDRKNGFRLAGRANESNIHTDEEFARQNIFGGTVNSGPATMSYVDRMLQLSFPPESFYNGGRLLMRAITPFRSGDTVTFQGEVTGKREEAGRGIVECRVRGINQRGDLVCLADATLALDR
jgi:acyl dehydratase